VPLIGDRTLPRRAAPYYRLFSVSRSTSRLLYRGRPAEFLLGFARVHDRRVRDRLRPLDERRSERQGHNAAGTGALEPRRGRNRRQPELAYNLRAAQHTPSPVMQMALDAYAS